MKGKVQVIDPRDMGQRQKVLRQPLFDEGAVSRADQTLEAMSESFEKWLDADIAKLQAARLAAEQARLSDEALNELWSVAHDLKGMGATYGYPLATQLAASLCRLIDTSAGKQAARDNPALMLAHVDALRAAARDRIATDSHPIGKALLKTLEAQVAALGVAPT